MSFISLPDLLAAVQFLPDPNKHSSGKRRILFFGSGCVVDLVDHDHKAVAAVVGRRPRRAGRDGGRDYTHVVRFQKADIPLPEGEYWETAFKKFPRLVMPFEPCQRYGDESPIQERSLCMATHHTRT
jgi:hypothetical protein